jgi:hypothetical protein
MHVVLPSCVNPSGYCEWPHLKYEVYILHTGYISVFCIDLGTNCYHVSVEDFAALHLKIPFFWICDAVSWVDKSIGFSVFENKDMTASKHQDPITHYGSIFLVHNTHRHTTSTMCQ